MAWPSRSLHTSFPDEKRILHTHSNTRVLSKTNSNPSFRISIHLVYIQIEYWISMMKKEKKNDGHLSTLFVEEPWWDFWSLCCPFLLNNETVYLNLASYTKPSPPRSLFKDVHPPNLRTQFPMSTTILSKPQILKWRDERKGHNIYFLPSKLYLLVLFQYPILTFHFRYT